MSPSTDGSVWRVHAGALSVFLPAATVEEGNGITISPDGLTLFVAGWHDIHRVDVATRAVRPLAAPDDVVSGSVAGRRFGAEGLDITAESA